MGQRSYIVSIFRVHVFMHIQSTTGQRAMDSGVKTLPPPSDISLKKKNPWGRPPQTTPTTVCSLAAVMDEELARKLQQEEESSQ